MLRQPRSSAKGGFTLIESLIAGAILALAVMASIDLYAVSDQLSTRSRVDGLATDVFSLEVGRFMNLSYDELALLATSGGGDGTVPYSETLPLGAERDLLQAEGPSPARYWYQRSAAVGDLVPGSSLHVDFTLTWQTPGLLNAGPITKTLQITILRQKGGE